ncbi:hypothetical protein RMSM_00242 [Rhodopirellula maiorica SM1]|uniref:Uncharacterized protein n=1 Tax=Rhodopirellula maiorica SM1 TaxID=1265738 RepID=M5RU24_9BACT|nr:hypothetical protein RMSM_00242 [Rhodopirellula maiorica SM1]
MDIERNFSFSKGDRLRATRIASEGFATNSRAFEAASHLASSHALRPILQAAKQV